MVLTITESENQKSKDEKDNPSKVETEIEEIIIIRTRSGRV
jgi:hypothetical protein